MAVRKADMGFGLLFVGYLFAYILRIGVGKYAFAGMLIGCFIMYLALGKLRRYCPSFIYALTVDIIRIFASFFEAVEGIDGLLFLNLGIAGSTAALVFRWITFALDLVFNILLLYSIADMANRVELPEIKGKSFRNMIFVGIFYALQLFLYLPLNIGNEAKNNLMVILTLSGLLYALLNSYLIFKCYAFICPEGDEEMARKPSRFAFINKINAERDAREQKAIDETKKYYEDKAREKREKRDSRYKSSQHVHQNKKKKK